MPEPTVEPRAEVTIVCVFYDGLVPRSESDEYVEIANQGDAPQQLAGWRLVDIADGSPSFEFPAWLLEPGDTVRVYTDEVYPEWGGFSFGRGSAIWSNDYTDEAGLMDGTGELVSARSYPPGCG